MNTDMSNLEWLQVWYAKHCDGVWEHSYGVKVDTLDNPGWDVAIDLAGTKLQGRRMDRVTEDHGERDWMTCWVEADQFRGCGDPSKLDALLGRFRRWFEQEHLSVE